MPGDRPEILRLDPDRDDPGTLARAVAVLRAEGVIAYPTETLYGIGCDPLSGPAVSRLVSAKGRPEGKPLPVLVGRAAHLPRVAGELDARFAALAERFWPGPLTLVVPAVADLAPEVTAGTGTVAVRWTSSILATRLLLAFDGPLVGTSANLAGESPATSVDGLSPELVARLDLILDGGPSPGTAPSTLVDLTVSPARVLREGALERRELEPYLD